MPDDKSRDIWALDRLDRASDAAFLKLFLINRVLEKQVAGQPASYVLNIDARWGQGKSFFLSRLGQSLEQDGYLVAKVNAWQDDHADDPLLSVMDAIDAAVAPLIKREQHAKTLWNKVKENGAAVAVAAVKGATVQIVKKAVGAGLDDMATAFEADVATEKASEDLAKAIGEMIGEQGKAMLASFREGKRTISNFRESIAQFLQIAGDKGQELPLFVLVDELDRCRPPFAIAMLERMKHLFDIDQVVFVTATDTTQLSHSIGAVYGSGFDSEGYLSRFFNRTYHFEETTRAKFVKGLMADQPISADRISLPPMCDLEKFLSDGFDFFALPLRSIEQVYDILRSFVTTWNHKSKIEMVPLLPIAVAHQQRQSLALNGDFSSRINQIAIRNEGAKTPWKLVFHTGNFSRAEESVDFVALANDFIGHAQRPLPDQNYDVSSFYSRWSVNRFNEEFALVHGNTIVLGRRPCRWS